MIALTLSPELLVGRVIFAEYILINYTLSPRGRTRELVMSMPNQSPLYRLLDCWPNRTRRVQYLMNLLSILLRG